MKYDGVQDTLRMIDAVSNNTFDLPSVEKVIRGVIDKSYEHLLTTQRNLIGMNRSNICTENIIEINRQFILSVNKDLIDVSCRKAFRLSEFYGKDISMDDISSNKKIFTKLPLLFVDGLLSTNYSIRVNKDSTEFILDYPKSFLVLDHQFTILFVSNAGIRNIITNKYVIEKYDNALPLSMINTDDFTIDGDSALFSICDGVNQSTLDIADITDGKLQIPKAFGGNRMIRDSREVSITLLNIPHGNIKDRIYNVKRKYDNNASCELFTLEDVDDLYDMPIPEENIIIMKYNADIDDFIINNNTRAKLHYPNIYEIIDENMKINDKYKVLYFYHNSADGISYDNKIESYLNLLVEKDDTANNVEDAINNIYFNYPNTTGYLSLFDKYFNFTDIVYTYSHGDFFTTHRPYHFDYKVDKMHSVAKAYPENIRDYIMYQNTIGDNYYLFVKDIDIASRRRLNNHNGTSMIHERVVFNEPCYMFAFRNDESTMINLRFFIDGLFYSPSYMTLNNNMQYIYIPTRLIKANSYIEIERFEILSFSTTLLFRRFELAQTINITSRDISPTLQDIYFVNKNTGEYIDMNNFKIGIDINGINRELNPSRFTTVTSINIELRNDNYYDIPLLMKINKNAKLYDHKMKSDGMVTMKISKHTKRDPAYIRMFLNSRLIPTEMWRYSYSTDEREATAILKFPLKKGDIVNLDVTPYKYKLIYRLKNINDNGIVDLKHIIDKPFDVSYYDIYVNGRKLNECNIINLSPTKIQLINISSFKNLDIFQKDRDNEYFKLSYSDNSYKVVVDELLDDTINIDDASREIIIDHIIENTKPEGVIINPNIDIEDDLIVSEDEMVDEQVMDMYSFYEQELLSINHLIPDIDQFRFSSIENYPYIADTMKSDGRRGTDNNVIHMNPDLNPYADSVIKISPYFKNVTGEMVEFTAKLFLSNMHLNPDIAQFESDNLISEYPAFSDTFIITTQNGGIPYSLNINPDISMNSQFVTRIDPQLNNN